MISSVWLSKHLARATCQNLVTRIFSGRPNVQQRTSRYERVSLLMAKDCSGRPTYWFLRVVCTRPHTNTTSRQACSSLIDPPTFVFFFLSCSSIEFTVDLAKVRQIPSSAPVFSGGKKKHQKQLLVNKLLSLTRGLEIQSGGPKQRK